MGFSEVSIRRNPAANLDGASFCLVGVPFGSTAETALIFSGEMVFTPGLLQVFRARSVCDAGFRSPESPAASLLFFTDRKCRVHARNPYAGRHIAVPRVVREDEDACDRFPSPNTYRVDLIAGTDEQPRKQSGIAS